MAGVTAETWIPFIIFLDGINTEGDEKIELDFDKVGNDRFCDVLYAQGGWGEGKKERMFTAQPRGGVTGAS